MQGVVGGVEVQNDFFGRRAFLGTACLCLVGREERLNEKGLDLPGIDGDLLVAGGCRWGLLQPVQRAFSRQGMTLVSFAGAILAGRVRFAHDR